MSIVCRILELSFATFCFLVFCFLTALPGHAALQIWSGGSLSSSNWSDPANWQSLTIPTGGDDFIFPPGALRQTNRNDLAAETSLNSITFSGAGYLVSGNSVRLVNGIQAQNSTGTNTFQPSITLSGDQTFTCFAAAATLALEGDVRVGANALTATGQGTTRLGGVISGTGGLVKNGVGRLVLAGSTANTHTGINRVNNGVLELRKNPPSGAIAIAGALVIGDGLGNASNDVVRLYAPNQLSPNSSVTVTRSGLLDLTNSSAPVFTLLLEDGNVTSSGGILHVLDQVQANTTAQGSHISGVLALAGGLRSFTVNHSGNSPGLHISASITDGATGSGGIIKQGDGTLTLASSNAYSGRTIVSAGLLQVHHSWGLGQTNEGTFVNPGTTLMLNSNARVGGEPLTLDGHGLNGLGVLRSSGTLSSWAGDIVLSSDCTIAVVGPSDSLLLTGAISGPGALKKILDGILTFGGANSNSYAGATFVEAGVLRLTKSGRIAVPGPLIIGDDLVAATNDVVALLAPNQIDDSAPITVRSSGVLELSGNSDIIGPLTLAGSRVTTTTGVLGLNGDVTVLESPAGPASISGQLHLGLTNRTFDVPDAATTLNVYAHISGDLIGLTKTGAGTLRFAGTNGNTYSGSTVLREGTLLLERSSGLVVIPGLLFIGDGLGTDVVRLGAAHQLADTAVISLAASGVLDFAGHSETIGALEGSGFVNISNIVLITGGNNASSHFAGTLAGPNGMLVKRGSGIFTLSGNNSYTGATRVDGGELRVNGTQPASDVSLHNGAVLSGTGRVGRVSVTRGIIAPGVSPGILSSGDLTLNSVTSYRLDLSGSGPGVGHDQISVAGTIDLANAILDLRIHPSFVPTEGMTFRIINNDGSDSIVRTFANLPEGATLNIGGLAFRVTYVGGDGNDVVLTLEDVAVAAETLAIAAGNGDGAFDRSECNELYIALSNPGTSPLRNVHALLVPLNEGATVAQPLAFYGDIPPGTAITNRIPFQIRTSSDFVCDPGPAGVQFHALVTSSNFSSFLISLALPAGCNDGTGECEGCPTVVADEISAADPVQTGQLARGAPSSCAVAKACPTVVNTTASFHYDAYALTNSSSNRLCITVTLNAACGNGGIFAAAYAGSFDPANPCANYLADIGTEPNPSGTFSFIAPANEQFVIVVHESQPNSGCANYTLSIDGLECAPPALAITALPDLNSVRLAWTTASPGYDLQVLPAIETGSWSNVINPPVVSDGKYVITNEAGAPSYFYRLQKQ